MMMSPRKYPDWKEAERRFVQDGFPSGAIVPLNWFYDALSIKRIAPEMTVAEADRLRLRFLKGFKKLEEALLLNHQIHLEAEMGKGYRVIPANEQTVRAKDRGASGIRKAMKKMAQRLVNVDVALLTAEEQRENRDSLANLAKLRGMLKGAPLIGYQKKTVQRSESKVE